MQNLPNILPMEVVVVGAGAALLCVAPALVSWTDARRRRRAERAALALRTAAPPVLADDLPPAVADAVAPLPVAAGVEPLEPIAAEPPVAPFEVPEEAAVASPEASTPSPDVSIEPEPAAAVASPPEVAEEAARFEVRLQELRRVRLPDLPSPAARDDASRMQLWHEGERLAERHFAAMASVPLSAAHRIQSSCLGGVEAAGTLVRLHFLLFPVLWPSSEQQAVAEAVFEIDRDQGVVRGWVVSRHPRH